VIGYADGATALWNINQLMTQAPQSGPKFPAAVDRVWIAGKNRYLVAESGGKLWVATIAAPHRAVAIPADGKFGVLVNAFGAVGAVQQTSDGYCARWLVDAVFDPKTVMPPQQFGKPVSGYVKPLDAPPAAPQFLTWLQDTPVALLADGRLVRWNNNGTLTVSKGIGSPVSTLWADEWSFAIVDRTGFVQVRSEGTLGVSRQGQLSAAPARMRITPDGVWLLAADGRGRGGALGHARASATAGGLFGHARD